MVSESNDRRGANGFISNEMINMIDTSEKMDEAQTKKDKTSISDELCLFGESSSVHGLKYVSERSSHCFRRIFWLLVILCCLGVLIYQIVDRVRYFTSNPVTVNVQVNYNSTLVFPAVTICNQNAFKATLAAEKKRYKLIEDMFTEPESFNSTSLQKDLAENITLEELYLQGAHKREDFIFRAIWMGKTMNPDDFDQFVTDHGVCYTFKRSETDGKVSSPGIENGLRLTLNIEQYEYMPGPHDAAGIKMLIHDHSDIPMVHALGQAISPGSRVFVGMKIIELENLPEPHGNCEEKTLEYVDTYTSEGCRLDCLTKRAKSECGCRALYMPHNNGDPPVCTLKQYYDCLKEVIERFPTLYYKICSCPVSCNFRLFETDLSYGTTSDYNLRKYLSSNDTTKFAQDLLNATEVTSRNEDTKLSVVQDFYSTLTNDTEKISNVHERLVTLVDGLINATDVVYQDMKNHYDFKDFLYKYQIYIMQKNFMRARDAMEERHIHIVPLAYTEFILLIEKSIRKLADTQFPNDTSRLVIYGNLNDKIDSRLEITERVIANYTSLRDAYIAGQKIFNYKYMDIPRAHNNPATPKKLIQDSVNHNSYANKSTVQFESFINKSVVTLNLCKDLAGIAYASYTVKEADLWLCVEDYRHAMRNWMYARSLFYYEIVERPERILQERLENFESLWTEFQLMFQNINQSLYSIRSENTDFGSDILTSIENSNRQLEQYLVANATKLSLSEDFLSNTTEDVLSKLTLYFQILKTRQTTLTDWISRLQSSAGDIWQNILNDEDSYDYYTYVNKNEYLKNFTEIESDLKSNFSTILDDVKFTDVIDGQDGQLLSTFNNIIAHMKEFQEALKVDSDFIRDNLLQINIFYREMSYEKIDQQIAYDMFSLWCDIGGTMGLFLGASFLSILEIADFVLHRVVQRKVTHRIDDKKM
ncbi:degenerin-like protein del-10 [Magallana gigas]|uniref:degenerin-like protein del-10 n=1 Tax=Magallana gigas TaxID=29159 RepID=UPI0033410C8B